MPGPLSLRVPRAALPLVGCFAGVVEVWLLVRDPLGTAVSLLGGDRMATVEQVVTAVCAAALVACALWWLAATALAAVTRVVTGRLPVGRHTASLQDIARQRCPRTVCRWAGLFLGMAVTASASGTACAEPAGADDLTGLAVPDRTTGAVVVTARRTALPRSTRSVVVAPGDSLWSIAADRLSPATDLQVTRAWQQLHRRNAARIGPDPDLIHPGTRLVVPGPAAPHREDQP